MWQKYSTLRLTLALVLGMTAAHFLMPLLQGQVPALFLLLALLGAVLCLLYFRPAILYHDRLFGATTLCFFFTLGLVLFTQKRTTTVDTPYWQKVRTITPFQQHIHDVYEQAGMDSETSAVLESVTVGNKSGLTRERRQQFSNAGIAHVLALSGLHLTILLAFFDLLLLRSYLPLRWRRITALLLIPLIWAYCLAAGAPASLIRAATMSTMIQLAIVIGTEYNVLNACAAAAGAMLLWNPLYLLDISFQLSFTSVLAITLAALPLLRYAPRRSIVLGYLYASVTISLVCTVFTLPIVAYYFGQVPTLSILSNIVVSLLLLFILYGSLLWWAFFWWTPVQTIIGHIVTWSVKAMTACASTLSALPFATFSYRPRLAEVVLLYVILACLVRFCRTREAKSLILLLSLTVIFVFIQLIDTLHQ